MTRLMCLDLTTEGGGGDRGLGRPGYQGSFLYSIYFIQWIGDSPDRFCVCKTRGLGCTHNIIIDARIGGEKGTEKCKF